MIMQFIEFAKYLQKLEKISSRLLITDVLAELIGKLEPTETSKGIYLVLGQLGPDFANKEFGMAVKMVIRAIAQGTGKSIEEVTREYKQKGDLGLLLEEMPFEKEKRKSHSLTEIYDYLLLIAEDSGFGSQERKVNKLSEILLEISATERKYISRMVVGKLRLGFSAKTIFDALSQMQSGNKTLRKELDSVFQIYPDPGLITTAVKEKGMAGLKDIKVKVGVPVVPALCQRLNEYGEIVEKMHDVAVERKYDGTRLQIHFNRLKNEVKTYTRNLEENSWMFPEILEMGNNKDVLQKEIVLLKEEVLKLSTTKEKDLFEIDEKQKILDEKKRDLDAQFLEFARKNNDYNIHVMRLQEMWKKSFPDRELKL